MFQSRPLRVLKRTLVLRIVYCLTLIPLSALSGLAAYAATTEETPSFGTAASCGGIVVGLLALLAWLFRRESSLEIRLHEEGIAAVAGTQVRELRWDEVEQVWFRAVSVQAHGLLGAAIGAAVDAAARGNGKMSEASTNVTVRLVGGGREIRLSSNYKGVVTALERVLECVNPRLVSDCLRRIETGQPVRFGTVALPRFPSRICRT